MGKPTVEVLISIIKSLPVPDGVILKHLSENADRLLYILWGKTDTYEGPLFDGIQRNEWAMIFLVVGNWSLEVYNSVIKDKTAIMDQVDLFFTKEHLTKFSFALVKEIINRDIVPGVVPEDVNIINQLENIPELYKFIEKGISLILEGFSKLLKTTCCINCLVKCGVKKVDQAKVEELTNTQGTAAMMANQSRMYQELAMAHVKQTNSPPQISLDVDEQKHA
jgi:hypothetical protein